jgi:hypothetical protein
MSPRSSCPPPGDEAAAADGLLVPMGDARDAVQGLGFRV